MSVLLTCDYFQSLKYFQWLYLTGSYSRIYTSFGLFDELFLKARFDWVTLGVL